MKKVYTREEVVSLLIKHGFEDAGWRGSHYRMRRGSLIIHIPKNVIMWRVYVKKIFRRAGISEEELE